MRTVGALFPSMAEAQDMRSELEAAGIPGSAVRVLDHPAGLGKCLEEQHDGRGTMVKAVVGGGVFGAAVFGIFGAFAGLGSQALGLGGFDLASMTTLIFVLVGLLSGVFLGLWLGISECECDTHLFLEGVKRGGAVLVVKTAGGQATQVLGQLQAANAVGAKICGGGGH